MSIPRYEFISVRLQFHTTKCRQIFQSVSLASSELSSFSQGNAMAPTRLGRWSILLATLLWSGLVLADTRKCYNPDSSQAVDDVPCTSDDTTWCCNKMDVCMSNGLCFLQQSSGFALSRPSCTDLSWDACGEWKYCCE